jgi:hypothetical protein
MCTLNDSLRKRMASIWGMTLGQFCHENMTKVLRARGIYWDMIVMDSGSGVTELGLALILEKFRRIDFRRIVIAGGIDDFGDKAHWPCYNLSNLNVGNHTLLTNNHRLPEASLEPMNAILTSLLDNVRQISCTNTNAENALFPIDSSPASAELLKGLSVVRRPIATVSLIRKSVSWASWVDTQGEINRLRFALANRFFQKHRKPGKEITLKLPELAAGTNLIEAQVCAALLDYFRNAYPHLKTVVVSLTQEQCELVTNTFLNWDAPSLEEEMAERAFAHRHIFHGDQILGCEADLVIASLVRGPHSIARGNDQGRLMAMMTRFTKGVIFVGQRMFWETSGDDSILATLLHHLHANNEDIPILADFEDISEGFEGSCLPRCLRHDATRDGNTKHPVKDNTEDVYAVFRKVYGLSPRRM